MTLFVKLKEIESRGTFQKRAWNINTEYEHGIKGFIYTTLHHILGKSFVDIVVVGTIKDFIFSITDQKGKVRTFLKENNLTDTITDIDFLLDICDENEIEWIKTYAKMTTIKFNFVEGII